MNKENLIGIRLNTLIKDLKISQKEFAESLDITPSLITAIIKGKRSLSSVLNDKIYNLYKIRLIIDKDNSENIIPIPFYNVKASAGFGLSFIDSPEKEVIYFDRRWLQLLGVNPAHLSLIIASGNSMDSGMNKPTDIKDGDLLLVDNSDLNSNNKVMVIETDKEILQVKKVCRNIDGSITLISYNPAFKPQTYKNRDIVEVDIKGTVVWNGSKGNI